jgi:hypothetical protein
MSLIQSGKIFTDGEQLTAAKLNQIVGSSTISTTGVDGSTIIVNENNTLAVRSGGIGSASLANSSVVTNKLPDSTDDTDGVTFPKIRHIDQNKVLGRVTTGSGIVEEMDFFDQDDLGGSGSSATAVASQQSIKTYVDSLFSNQKPNIVQFVKRDTFTNLNPQNQWLDFGFEVKITPRFSNSKIRIRANVSSSTNNGNYGNFFRLCKDGAVVTESLGDADGNRTRCTFTGGYSGTYTSPSNGMDFIDETAVTAGTEITYKLQVTNETTVDIYINRSLSNGDVNEIPRPISTITVEEIYQD